MKLSDLFAPEWSLVLGGTTWQFKPLSLETFAAAEGYGVTLHALSEGKDPEVWVTLFAHLAGMDTHSQQVREEILAAMLGDPLALDLFRNRVAESFSGTEQQRTQQQTTPTKQPRRKVQKFQPEPVQEPSMDYAFLIDIARTSGIPLRDLRKMTFYGVTQVSQSLEKIPPMPQMF